MDHACRPRRAVVLGLLCLHAALLVIGLRQNFVTIDETGHVPAGLSHWQTGSFALYRVNPPLPRMLATLPLLLLHPQTSPPPRDDVPGQRPEWDAGPAFAVANAARYFDLVCVARWAGIAWSLLGGGLIYRWASELYGFRGGWLALVLWCFGPNVLAHAQLVTPDVPATVAGLAATYVFWRYLRRPSWTGAWFAGLLLGVAQLTKCTLLVLYGLWPVLALLFWCRRGREMPEGGWRRRLGQAALLMALSVVVLNLGYGLAGTGRPLGEFRFVSRLFAGEPPAGRPDFPPGQWGNRFQDCWVGALPAPVPADYLLGMDAQRRDFEGQWPCYFGGEWRSRGRWYFYLYALAIKVPLGTLGLTLAGLALTLVCHPASAPWREELAVYLPAAVLLSFVSSQTGLNYFRYGLPLAPFALVGAGKLGYFLQSDRWRIGAVVLGLLLWSAGSSLAVYPHSLSYFNEVVGGPERGDEYLVDSNLDWGQDVLRLKAWLDDHPDARPLYLACFTHVDPRLWGIEFDLPPALVRRLPDDPHRDKPERQLAPGHYVVSVNFVRGMPFPAPDGSGRFRRVPAHAYEYLGRLRPRAKVGYTLLIYHITTEDAKGLP